jgi:ribosomal protein S25
MNHMNLSERQRLVFEACQKILNGNNMAEEGMIEFRNLMPDKREGKTIANKILRSTTKPNVTARVLDIVKTEPYVNVRLVMEKLGIAWATANKVLQSLRTNGVIKLVKKMNNPVHKGTTVYNRVYDYWVVV